MRHKVFLLLFFLFFEHIVFSQNELTTRCNLKYPLVLVRGVGLSQKLFFVPYWGRIPSALHDVGVETYDVKQNIFGTHISNAHVIKRRILEILHATNSEKVNIISHSRGGIDCRYMISKLDMGEKVASLTMLSTPHRGIVALDEIFDDYDSCGVYKYIIYTAFDACAIVLHDNYSDFEGAVRIMTTYNMAKFNKEVLDNPSVYYQSYSATISENYPSKLWSYFYRYSLPLEGEGDGFVSEASAAWGNYRGRIVVEGDSLIDHGNMVDLGMFSGVYVKNIPSFYISLVKDLAKRGF